MPYDIVERAIGLALGTAVGDAKGIAYETLTRQQIIDLQNEEKHQRENNTESLYAPVNGRNPYIPLDWQIGRWTDDTQLTLAMMRALTNYLRSSNTDLMSNIVAEHIIEWRESIAGWGGTKNAIERLALGTHTYLDSGNPAEGNGVLMKLAPLAFYYSITGKVNDDEIERICRMTHTTPVALTTACIYVHMCVHLFQQPISPIDLLPYVYQLALKYETKYQLVEDKHLVSVRIQRFLDAGSSSNIDETRIIEVSNGGTYQCVNSLTMIIGLIVTSPDSRPDFTTLLRASEIGGDTDSNAAMIGALVGGMQGVKAIEQEHIVQLYRSDDVRRTGEEFGNALTEYLRARNEDKESI